MSRRLFVTGAAASAVVGCSNRGTSSGSATAPVSRATEPPADAKPAVTAVYRARATEVDFAGRVVKTVAYDDAVPGKLLRARKGDLVEVTVHNEMTEATTIHWHGLAIVNAMDGVPGVTQPDIMAGSSFTYRFVVPDGGTYWFHPHHGLQLDRGLYAPLVVDDPDDTAADQEYVLVLDDWLDGAGTTPEDELVRIREAGAAMGSMSGMDHSSMGGMARSPLLGGDAGDALYPFHLINGRPPGDPATLDPQPVAGSKVRLRIINAGGDTAYRFAVGGHRLTVTHTDGFAVEPTVVDALVIGMGERYDVAFTVASGAWPIVALAEGKDQRAVAVLRTRDATATTAPNLTTGPAELEGKWLRYSDLRAAERSALRPPAKVRSIPVRLTGGMGAYDWAIDGRGYGNHKPIIINEGEWVSLDITNSTMMWHPIHLHGHTPQLGAAPGSIRKDTVNILPMNSASLVFQADNPGRWMLHCHNAYHLETGMATTVVYKP